MNRDILAFVFGCSIYCPCCAASFEGQTDADGEDPRPVYSWDTWESEGIECCADCHEMLPLDLSRSGALNLLEDIRHAAQEKDGRDAALFLKAMRLHKWTLRHAGLTDEEREDLESKLEAKEKGEAK